ncbi:hypothetical protein FEM48_Zijuj07G0074900 [Ziziphus jujuba var. spinosa]|uniref:Uncharacterized protein n=1 Tax=Ziziphus jujuba var. spinosa TaxID=714518 RepID=A0A978V3A9_ZIZJJ|nr:hypothetical protein FEM48_Zijuj07G0074900 [Ziziphus jujuba var. spinosa]
MGVLVFLAAKSGFIDNAKEAAQFQNFIICFEMLIAAIGHLFAFRYKEYAGANIGGSRGLTGSLAHALRPKMDAVKFTFGNKKDDIQHSSFSSSNLSSLKHFATVSNSVNYDAMRSSLLVDTSDAMKSSLLVDTSASFDVSYDMSFIDRI